MTLTINEALAVGKGATVQEFVTTIGEDRLEIDVAPWGEGHIKVNGVELAHVNDAKDRRRGELVWLISGCRTRRYRATNCLLRLSARRN